MRFTVRPLVPFAFAALVAACGGSLAPTDLSSLDGAWTGEISRVRGDQPQCKDWGLQMTIRGGAVTGQAFALRAPAARWAFNSYVETDGRMFVDLRAGGEIIQVTGSFSRNSFSGTSHYGN